MFSQTVRSPSASPARSDAPAADAPAIEGFPLSEVEELADLPDELQRQLAALARVESLAADEEVAGFGAVLVLEGSVVVCATIVDIPAFEGDAKTLIPGLGTLAEGVPLRVVGGPNGARVAVWMPSSFEPVMKLCPWVLDELRQASDRIQARAGATMGPLEALEDASRQLVLARLSARVLRPQEVITEAGKPMPGLAIVGVGTIELLDGDQVVGESRPGDALFPDAALMGTTAPQTSRASSGGAILLVASRQIALDLLSQVPPLIEVLSR
jgi:hypothetical protein